MRIYSKYTTIDGIKIHHLEAGSGKPLILLHAFFSNAETFRGLMGYLGSRYKVYVPDYPGFGKSESYNISWDWDQYNKIIADWIYKRNIKDFILTGVSLGGTNIVYLTKKIEPLVKSFIFIEPYSGRSALKLNRLLIVLGRLVSAIVDVLLPQEVGNKLWNSDRAVHFLLNTIDPFKSEGRQLDDRMLILRAAEFKTFIHSLRLLLETEMKTDIPISQKPALFLMSKTEDSLDYSKTFEVFSSLFPNMTEMSIDLIKHFPTEPITTRYFKINYPRLLEDVSHLI